MSGTQETALTLARDRELPEVIAGWKRKHAKRKEAAQ